MTYATEVVQRYRLALHQLWNLHFWAPEPFRSLASVEQFNRIKHPLFVSLVLPRLGTDLEEPSEIFGRAYKLVPPMTEAAPDTLSFMVERSDEKGVWKTIELPFAAGEIELCILDFFDWQLTGWRDFRYYLSRIEKCEGDPSLIGSQALVEVNQVDVLWNPPRVLGLPITSRMHEL